MMIRVKKCRLEFVISFESSWCCLLVTEGGTNRRRGFLLNFPSELLAEIIDAPLIIDKLVGRKILTACVSGPGTRFSIPFSSLFLFGRF